MSEILKLSGNMRSVDISKVTNTFDIVEIDGIYCVTVGGDIDARFYSLTDAQDHKASLMWECDNAWSNIGCEFDEPWME